MLNKVNVDVEQQQEIEGGEFEAEAAREAAWRTIM